MQIQIERCRVCRSIELLVLDIGTHAVPQTAVLADPHDPNGRKPGDRVAVMPDDYGKIPVRGEIVALSAQHVAIRRHDVLAGDTVVHFPRAGFSLLPDSAAA